MQKGLYNGRRDRGQKKESSPHPDSGELKQSGPSRRFKVKSLWWPSTEMGKLKVR